MEDVDLALNELRFSDAVSSIYLFAWQDFCDWYLEFSKMSLYETAHSLDEMQGAKEEQAEAYKRSIGVKRRSRSPRGEQLRLYEVKDNCQGSRQTTSVVVFQVLARLLKLMHPFVPFISEEIFSKIPIRDEEILCTSKFPKRSDHRIWLEQGSEDSWLQVEWLKEVISCIRNIRGENSIALAQKIEAYIFTENNETENIIQSHRDLIKKFCQLSELYIEDRASRARCAVSPLKFQNLGAEIIISLEGFVDMDREIQRIEKNIDKIQKDMNVLSKKIKQRKLY